MRFLLALLLLSLPCLAKAESDNDEPFYAFQDNKAYVEKDSMYRVDQAVVFKYRIDVESSQHPWKSMTRMVKTQCDSNNFTTISATIVFKDTKQASVELKGDGEYVQYEPRSYREQMTKYVCKHAPS